MATYKLKGKKVLDIISYFDGCEYILFQDELILEIPEDKDPLKVYHLYENFEEFKKFNKLEELCKQVEEVYRNQ